MYFYNRTECITTQKILFTCRQYKYLLLYHQKMDNRKIRQKPSYQYRYGLNSKNIFSNSQIYFTSLIWAMKNHLKKNSIFIYLFTLCFVLLLVIGIAAS